MSATPSLAVEIAGLRLRNPFMAASGTCGYGVEIAHVVDLSTIGAIVTKGLYMAARDGCEVPRIAETPSGLLNAIGLVIASATGDWMLDRLFALLYYPFAVAIVLHTTTSDWSDFPSSSVRVRPSTRGMDIVAK